MKIFWTRATLPHIEQFYPIVFNYETLTNQKDAYKINKLIADPLPFFIFEVITCQTVLLKLKNVLSSLKSNLCTKKHLNDC